MIPNSSYLLFSYLGYLQQETQIQNGSPTQYLQPPTEYIYGRPILGVRRGINQMWVSSLLETHLQKGLSFRSCCWRRPNIGIEPFAYSATQRSNGSCILGRGCWRQSNNPRQSKTMLYSIYPNEKCELSVTDACGVPSTCHV